MNQFNWDTSFSVDFDLESGISKKAETTKRYLSQMKDMYYDTDSAERILEESDPLIYEFHELGCPERSGDLAFGTTILYPGCVGDEYYMTKGHFHTILETAEVYYTLSGEGYMVMENPEGDTLELPLRAGEAVYVPRRYAHRSVNTGDQPLVMFYTFGADAGHDYGTIETKGYHKLIVKREEGTAVIDNPKWKQGAAV
ncbi:MAG: cupin domain-containing protein [Lachnospiraceae bacterium]|nr:cupin domain-containing protein [Lachnospiraceae bacterium]